MQEPAETLQVASTRPAGNSLDIRISLGFEASWKTARIQREAGISPDSPGPGFLDLANYRESTSRLLTQAEVGVYRDVSLLARMPVVLANDRELLGLGNNQIPLLRGTPGEQLFELNFRSPSRSGVEYLALGVNALVSNQMRNPSNPTWLLGAELRLSVAEPQRACNRSPHSGQAECTDPSDRTRLTTSRKPGISRGVTGVETHSYFSRRLRYIEPHVGLSFLVEFPNSSSEFGSLNWARSHSNHLPLRSNMVVGTAIIPWEVREQQQRALITLQLSGHYISEGRDYSELFDALGSSDAPSLRQPQSDGSQSTHFTGLTQVQAHTGCSFNTEFTWQTGQYIKFKAGGSYTFTQNHLLTAETACPPNTAPPLASSGACINTADGTATTTLSNPNFRSSIDGAGRRFQIDSAQSVAGWVRATVMF